MEAASSYRALLRTPAILPMLVTMALSRLAGRMFALALVLLVLARFGSPVLAGWLTFAAYAAGLVVSPVAGALLDRMGPTVAIRIDLAASGACAAAIALASWTGRANAPVLALLAVFYALTGPFGAAGVRSLLPRLAAPEALDRVNAVDTAIWAVADILGPALAGLLAAALGPEAAMLVVGAAYGGAAGCLLAVPVLPGRGGAGVPLMAQSLEGLLLVLRHKALRGLSLSYSFYQLAWGVLVVAAPVTAARHLPPALAQAATGGLWAAAGLAGGAGALAAGHLRTAGREARIMAVGMLVSALALWPVAASFGLGGLALGMCVAGLAAGPVDVAALTLRQRATDPALLGRVLSISMSLNLLGLPVGSALAGVLIVHAPGAVFAVAALAALAGAVMARRVPVAEG